MNMSRKQVEYVERHYAKHGRAGETPSQFLRRMHDEIRDEPEPPIRRKKS